jgi:hypothetical protein
MSDNDGSASESNEPELPVSTEHLVWARRERGGLMKFGPARLAQSFEVGPKSKAPSDSHKLVFFFDGSRDVRDSFDFVHAAQVIR